VTIEVAIPRQNAGSISNIQTITNTHHCVDAWSNVQRSMIEGVKPVIQQLY
jgi:hypothetical protein